MRRKNLFLIPFDAGADIVGANEGVNKIFLQIQANKNIDNLYYMKNKVLLSNKSETADVYQQLVEISPIIQKLIQKNDSIMFISGDHSITYYLYRICASNFNEPPVLVILDAHSDSSRLYDGWINQGTFVRELTKNIKPEIFHIGIRYDPIKLSDIDEMVYPAFSFLHHDGLEDFFKRLGNKPCYVSIDIDVLDPSICPGVNFPVPGGLSKNELLNILKKLFQLNVIAFDLVEYVPQNDVDKKSLQIAIEIIENWVVS
ncbi:arginase family protein [Paenibacillus periandrae]|uniref:arginase family protein n=1 Tax=Paenibacillus periandrae TaxID=1761741 RepID=UPI001F08A8C5|nr:arginase family protein [Paenibacillus periandrae]